MKKNWMRNTAAMLALVGFAQAQGAAAQCGGKPGVGALHSEWILQGWEKRAGDGDFDFRAKLGKYYDLQAGDGVFYDDFDPQHRVARSADAYGAIWQIPFTELRSARHQVIDGPETIQGRDLATSTLEFAAALESGDGKVTNIRTRSSLVWRCRADGWKIVREHNSSRVVAPAPAGAAASNRAIVAGAFAAWAAGGKTFFDDVLAEDVVWTIKGSGPAAGTYRGRADFIERAVKPFAVRLASPVKPAVRKIWSEGDDVVIHWDGEATAKDGKPYRNSYVWIFQMRAGRAAAVVAYLDLVPYDDIIRRIPQ